MTRDMDLCRGHLMGNKNKMLRLPTPPGKSWIFFLGNSRTREIHFGPAESYKNILEGGAFSGG